MKKYIHLPTWLEILLAVIFILRIPSFFEPFSYGDEMIYLTLGEGIKQGAILYKDIHDNKPPLLYFIAAIAGNVFWFRVILSFWMLATTVLFWKLATFIFQKKGMAKVSTIVFAVLTTIPLLEGNVANAELFMMGPVIAGFLILLTKKHSILNLFLSGLCFSISALFKIPAAFDLPVIIFFWVITAKLNKKSVLEIIKSSLVLVLGFAALLLLSIFWYAIRGAFSEYMVAAFLQNVGYLSSWRPAESEAPFFVKNAPLFFRAGIVLLGSSLLFVFRKKLASGFIFATLWLLFTLFAVTLSERPYPHYLLQSVPAISLLVGFLVLSKKREQTLSLIPLFIAFFVPFYFKFYYYQTYSYYERFSRLAVGQISKEEYFSMFDGNVLRNYKVAEYVSQSTQKKDKIFVWGDSPPIYALSRRLPPLRFVATYHINDFSSQEEVYDILSSSLPSLIVVLPESPSFPLLEKLLAEKYVFLRNIDGALIYKHMDPAILGKLKNTL